MAYKIIVLHAGGAVAAEFLALLEEAPVHIINLDCRLAQLPEFDTAVASMAFDLIEQPLSNSVYTKALTQLLAQCAEHAVPLLQLGSYQFAAEGATGELLEQSLAAMAGDNFWARREAKLEALTKYICLRCGWLMDAGEGSLFELMVPGVLSGSASLCVSDHHYGSPVSSVFVASVLFALQQQILCGADNWGVFHVRSADVCSEAEFCDHLVRQLSKDLGQSVTLPSVAGADDSRRLLMGDARLLGSRLMDGFGIQMPTWRRGFGRLLRAWMRERGLSD